jgi:hypothetical protein
MLEVVVAPVDVVDEGECSVPHPLCPDSNNCVFE